MCYVPLDFFSCESSSKISPFVYMSIDSTFICVVLCSSWIGFFSGKTKEQMYKEISTMVRNFADKIREETESMDKHHTKELVLLNDKKTGYDKECDNLGKDVVDRQLLISYYRHKQKVEMD